MINVRVALVFEDETAARIAALSQRLSTCLPAPSDYCHGTKSIPHITVLHMIANSGDEENLRETFLKSPVADATQNIDFIGLKIAQGWKDEDNVIGISIAVQPTSALLALQRSVRTAFPDQAIGNGLGDGFKPHITLGRYRKQNAVPALIYDDILMSKSVKSRLIIGLSDEIGQLVQII